MKSTNFKIASFLSGSNLALIAVFAAFYAFTVHGEKDQKTVSVSADKMNVLYIGVDNPLTVAVEGIPDENVRLASDQAQLTKTGRGRYNVAVKTPGTASILVHGEGFENQTLTFRVKRIPDPIATLENPNLYFKTEGAVTAEEFRETAGVMLSMGGCFDYDNHLRVKEFNIVKVPKMGDPVEVLCPDGKLTDTAKKLIDSAVAGDTYYFELVKVKLEGDMGERKLNGMVFKIK
jgi:hypothetical protein